MLLVVCVQCASDRTNYSVVIISSSSSSSTLNSEHDAGISAAAQTFTKYFVISEQTPRLCSHRDVGPCDMLWIVAHKCQKKHGGVHDDAKSGWMYQAIF